MSLLIRKTEMMLYMIANERTTHHAPATSIKLGFKQQHMLTVSDDLKDSMVVTGVMKEQKQYQP